jgi:hypothetical protein
VGSYFLAFFSYFLKGLNIYGKLTGTGVLYLVYGLSEVFQIKHEVFYLPVDAVTFVEALEKNLVQKFSEVGGI